jgi:hypothetical protein
MPFKFKKVHYVVIGIIAFLVITNPTLKDFKEYLGLSSYIDNHVFASRKRNYFICSTYSINGSADKYFAIAGNIFYIRADTIIKPTPQTAKQWTPPAGDKVWTPTADEATPVSDAPLSNSTLPSADLMRMLNEAKGKQSPVPYLNQSDKDGLNH